jgi:hypothetical protein
MLKKAFFKGYFGGSQHSYFPLYIFAVFFQQQMPGSGVSLQEQNTDSFLLKWNSFYNFLCSNTRQYLTQKFYAPLKNKYLFAFACNLRTGRDTESFNSNGLGFSRSKAFYRVIKSI